MSNGFRAQFTVVIPRGYSAEKRQAIADRIVQYVRERTLNGKDINGKAFPKYTKEYAEKKGQSSVDLYVSGEMLDALQVLKIGFNTITIGYDGPDELMGKVEGNVLGTYGQQDPIAGKARNFLGISDKDLNLIISEFPISEREQLEGIQTNVAEAQIQAMTKRQREALLELALGGG